MKVKKRTSKLSGKKAHPVLTEKLTLDRANIMFFMKLQFFHYRLTRSRPRSIYGPGIQSYILRIS